MARNPLAQFALTAVAGVLAATLISWEGDDRATTASIVGGALETEATSRLPLTAEFTGVAEDDESLWWQAVSSAGSPLLSLRIRPLNDAQRSTEPQWRVDAHLEAEGSVRSPSLVADLAGTLDWRAGVLRLDGTVPAGASAGDRVRVKARVIDLDLRGVILIEHASHIAVRTYLR
jgi:hypothetical protein